jgi:adenylate cyclase
VQPQKEQRVERRLAAIFAADVAGYSRLMSQDEAGTLRALAAAREIMDGLIAEHGGRIANTAGDSVLAEFPSVVDAVQCAVAVQERLGEASAGDPEDRRLYFRIGVHVGDVVLRGGDLLGDGVNVAARLESLAEPGGIAISDAAHSYVRKALPLAYTDLGAQHVKNIDDQIRVFALKTGETRLSAPPVSLPLPNRPSMAVLPFANLSGDPEQDYFCDGLVEEITTALSRFKALFVIARNSSFTYKGRAVDIERVGQELGVRYILEGSIRKSDSRVRVITQLVEAASRKQIWGERYEREITGIFELQDELTQNVVAAAEPNVRFREIERARAKPTDRLDAYDLYLRALPELYRFNEHGFLAAKALLAQATGLDPNFSDAWAALADCFVRLYNLRYGKQTRP